MEYGSRCFDKVSESFTTIAKSTLVQKTGFIVVDFIVVGNTAGAVLTSLDTLQPIDCGKAFKILAWKESVV